MIKKKRCARRCVYPRSGSDGSADEGGRKQVGVNSADGTGNETRGMMTFPWAHKTRSISPSD